MAASDNQPRLGRRDLLKSAALAGIALAPAASVALSACAKQQASSTVGSLRFLFIVKTPNSDYWQTVLNGGRLASQQLGLQALQFTGGNSEANIEGQIALVEDAIAKRPDFLVLAPTSATALDATIDKVAAAGIKVILIDSTANTQAYTTFLATDNRAGGVLAARTLAEAIKRKRGAIRGQVAYSTFLSGVGSLTLRDQGFLEGLRRYPGLELVAHKDAGGDQSLKPIGIVADTLTRFPNLAGYFADSLITLQGAVIAFRENHVDSHKVALVGFDPSPQLLDALKAGIVDGIILQDPFQMGYGGVVYGVAAVAGVTTPKFLNTGVTAATPFNIDDPHIGGLLSPSTQTSIGIHLAS